jgi:hypothetical protein
MRRFCIPICGLFLLVSSLATAAEFELQKDEQGVSVMLDGKLFTRYLVKSGAKPILWPIIGPTGKPLTRAYPMEDGGPTEKKDHIHHRSFWFDHGDVNGISFWDEQGKNGEILHRRYDRLEAGGEKAVIATTNDWVAPDGTRLIEDQRIHTFGADDTARWIDFDVTVRALQDVTFGDTKEGSFGVRVAGTMKVDSKLGGQIINSEGQTNLEAWGKPAAWVDYHGPVGDEEVGIAILNHPSSFRYPTYWHVRTYGLFAANPFGLHDFERSKDVDGSHRMKAGDSFQLKYRVLLHKGDEKQGKVAEVFAKYSGQPPTP